MFFFTGIFFKVFAVATKHREINRLIVLTTALLVLFLNACTPSTPATIPAPDPETETPDATFTKTSTPRSTLTPTQTATTTETPPPKTSTQGSGRVTLMAVGDVMLGRTIGELILSEGPEAPFIDTAPTLSSADITVGNLECPVSDRGDPERKTYAFRAPPAAAESLAFAGFDLVSLANNHTLDYGPLALADTIENLVNVQITPVGAGMNAEHAYQPVIMAVNGLSIAFLAYADIPAADYDYLAWEAGPKKAGIAWAHPERVQQGVRDAKRQADVVVVLLHNGYEIVQRVSSGQQKIARLAIDSGAALVIGSHPHVLQRLETYNNGLIAYSMGNFVFDNFLFPPNYSAILKVELSEQGVESYEMIDVIVQLNGVPQIMPYNLED